ncbi:type II secretion system F family protein [Stackebrandtia soli]|uniref:type II secretion system F family protein n=1 Tax=Stackebrandtia soli TaxID=1892856 RepID=UPI0039EABC3F
MAIAATMVAVLAATYLGGPAWLIVGGYIAALWRGVRRRRLAAVRASRITAARHRLDVMAADLRAGVPASDILAEALNAVDVHPELRRLRDRLGVVERLTARVGVGAAELLERVAVDERARARLERVNLAQTAGGAASARLLSLLPFAGILLGEALGARPLEWLFGTGAGALAFATAAVLHGVGAAWANRVIHPRSTPDASPSSTASARMSRLRSWRAHAVRTARRRSVLIAIAATVAITAAAAVVSPILLAALVAVPRLARTGARQWGERRRRAFLATAARALPFALDLLAACLRAGAPLPEAVGAVAEVVPPSLAVRFRSVERALRCGEPDPYAAWADVPGGDRLTRAAARSARTGAGLADGLIATAEDLRADHALDAEVSAARSGVWLVLPLCLCFLPAFIVAGLVPIVMSIIGQAIPQ